MRAITVLLLLQLGFPAYGTVYKWTDPAGQIHYTDQWREGSKAVDLPEPSVYTPRPMPSATQPGATQGQAAAGNDYDVLEVTSPAQDETVRNNEGKVSVGLRLEPTLKQGDAIELLIDGKQIGGPLRGTSATLSNLDRGTHSITARVVDAKGRELISSQPVSFHLRRESKLFPNR